MLEFTVKHLKKEQEKAWEQLMEEEVSRLSEAHGDEACYAASLGWKDVQQWASEERLTELEQLAADIREKADVFVLIGVGGSNNAARSVIEALQKKGTPKIVYAGNTLSPEAVRRMLEELERKSVYIDCIAKNFETLEPGVAFRVLRRYLYGAYGEQAAERIICTGSRESLLEKLCEDEGYTFLEFPENVGGRYTAMTAVGLLPMAVAGVDIRALVRGASGMQRQLHEKKGVENPAYRYACLRNALYREGYRLEMLSSFEPRFRWFYKWWVQLFAESEGKDEKGIFPVTGEFSEALHAVGQFLQGGSPLLFETFLHVRPECEPLVILPDSRKDAFDYLNGKDFQELNEAAYAATVKAHSVRLPCLTLEVRAIDAYHFGQLFYFFQFACYLSCKIMGVNPFDQPGVEAYKAWMFEALGKPGAEKHPCGETKNT